MSEVSAKVVKKSTAAKTSRFPKTKPVPVASQPIKLKVPSDRKIPRPLHGPAKTTMRIILEHAYWLGDALQDGDKARAQREVDELARYARYYRTFASNPNNQKLKFSSNVDNYGKKKKISRMGRVTGDDDYEDNNEDTDDETTNLDANTDNDE